MPINQSPVSNLQSPQQKLHHLIKRVKHNENITIHLSSQITQTSGFMGNFASIIGNGDGSQTQIKHGATILTTGGQEYRGPEYGYGTDPRIITQQEFEAFLTGRNPISLRNRISSVVMIQCVGPAETYCSRICCTVALKNALALKQQNPDAQVVIFYRDIRTYGFGERLYTEARRQGVLFVRYDKERKPEVRVGKWASKRVADSLEVHKLTISAWEPVLRRPFTLHPDLLVLSMPVVPRKDAHQTANLFKVPLDADGYFQEAHVKLRPVDFTTDGVFMAGMAHYPKLLDETMIQAQAAAARAARVLSQETITAGGRVAIIDEAKCTGCLTCVRICPFGVPQMKPNLTGVGEIMGAAYVETAVCQGCGSCVSECPARAIQLTHYTDAQMEAKVNALLEPMPGFVPLAEVVGNKTLKSGGLP